MDVNTRLEAPRRRRCRQLFEAAIELPSHRRQAFVDEMCGDDASLHREVSSLLQHDIERSETQAGVLGGGDWGQTLVDEQPAAEEVYGPGLCIEQYELIRELDRGGMGTVYVARDVKLGRRVAIKFLQRVEPKHRERFILEARTTARCSHENIVVIHEVNEHRGHPFMVLEYLRGKPLTKRIAGQVLPPGRAVELMIPVVRALVCAHAENIVHRDLKPDNIFVTDTGHIKVLDFGIAKYLRRQKQIDLIRTQASTIMETSLGPQPNTQAGTLVGTLRYMSPEQWGAGEIDHRTDLWAVGVILFQMVTGRHPLHGRQGFELSIVSHLDTPMPSVRAQRPDVPSRLADLIDQCLVKYKEKRIASARKLLAELEKLRPRGYSFEIAAGESPYTGLKAFQERDAQRFFGRAREIGCMLAQIRDQPLIGVVGPSGVGKSSLVRAGVIPALKRSGETWDAIVVRPGRNPMQALASMVTPMIQTAAMNLAESVSKQEAMARRLYREPGFLGVLLRTRARAQQSRTLLFVDQFEELYTLVSDPRERAAFTACLRAVADDATAPLRVMLSIRADFLHRVAEDQTFMAELMAGLFFLAPPERHGLREVLTQPAEMAGYRFQSDDLVETMLDCLQGSSGALPLLQFAATKLWELRDQERRILTRESYERIGGVDGALASHADTVLRNLPPERRELTRLMFLRLVTADGTRAIATTDELCALSPRPGEVQRLIDWLVDARLLVVQSNEDGGGATVEIVHESLIHRWPQLRQWLDDNQDDVIFLERLRGAAAQWDAGGRQAGLLWRGEAMAEAGRWARRYQGELPAIQRAYLDAVLALARRLRRNRRLAVIGTMGVLSLLVVASTVVALVIREAQQEAQMQAQNYAGALGEIRLLTGSLGEKDRAYDARIREILGRTSIAEGMDEVAASAPDVRVRLVRLQEELAAAGHEPGSPAGSAGKAHADSPEDQLGEGSDAAAHNAQIEELEARIQELELQAGDGTEAARLRARIAALDEQNQSLARKLQAKVTECRITGAGTLADDDLD